MTLIEQRNVFIFVIAVFELALFRVVQIDEAGRNIVFPGFSQCDQLGRIVAKRIIGGAPFFRFIIDAFFNGVGIDRKWRACFDMRQHRDKRVE
jgi:hypothetical protein